MFLPSGGSTNRVLCFHARILKGQRLLRAITLELIEREHDVRKKRKNRSVAVRAACKRNRGGSDSRPAGGLKKKEKCFFFLASNSRKCTFLKEEVLKQL